MANPRTRPGAYITDGSLLFEVVGVDGKRCVIEDCSDGSRQSPETWRLKAAPWRLVRAAPRVPDPSEASGPRV